MVSCLVFFDEEKAAQAREDPDSLEYQHRGGASFPVINSVLAFFGLVRA